jgi:hypothetical protein
MSEVLSSMRSIIRILLASAALGALSPFAGAAIAWGDDVSRTNLAYLWFFSWPTAIENALFGGESNDYAVMALVYALQYFVLLLILDGAAQLLLRLLRKGRYAHHQHRRVTGRPG